MKSNKGSGGVSVDSRARRSRALRLGGRLLFWAWGLALLALVSTLMVGHWYTLPGPALQNDKLKAGIGALRGSEDDGRWLTVHVLYSECRCSQRILEHLFESPRPDDVSEKIVLVGEHADYERRGREAGFAVHTIRKADLEQRFGLVAAPLLAIATPEGEVVYAAGYTDRKQGPDIRDLALIEQARSAGTAQALPLFGCAVSRELQSLLDPLGVKYANIN